MIKFSQEAYILELEGSEGSHEECWNIHIGCSSKKRNIKINNSAPSSYKELVTLNPIVSIIEHDLSIISGSPEERRSLIDSMLLVNYPEMASLFRQYRSSLEQRNALLQQHAPDQLLLDILTEQLWQKASIIRKKRQELLALLNTVTQAIYSRYYHNDSFIELTYQPKVALQDSYTFFKESHVLLFAQEKIAQRSLFGTHIDDIHILFFQKPARLFASRGQQKLILFMLKLAQCALLNKAAILLLDDVLSDFDEKTMAIILELVRESSPQVFITLPFRSLIMQDFLRSFPSYQEIRL